MSSQGLEASTRDSGWFSGSFRTGKLKIYSPHLGLGRKLPGSELHFPDGGQMHLEQDIGPVRSRPASPAWHAGIEAWNAHGMKLSSLGIKVMVARAMSSLPERIRED